MNRLIQVLLALAVIGSVGAVAWILGRPADGRLPALETELKAARAEITELKAELARRPAKSKSAPLAAKAPATDGQSAKATANIPPAPAAGRPQGLDAKGLREMFKTPGMRAMMEQQQAMQIDLAYAKLFGYLNLNEEETAHFKKLLLEREKAQIELGFKMMDDTLTPEQRKQLAAQHEDQKKTFDAAIKTFLNDEGDWKTFQHWEDTKPERTQLETMGRSLFQASGEPLSSQQEEQLIELMTNIRKQPSDLPKMNDPATFNPSQLTDDMIQRQLQQLDANARKLEQAAQGFLTPTQLQALVTMNAQLRNMSEMGLRMSGVFMNGGKK